MKTRVAIVLLFELVAIAISYFMGLFAGVLEIPPFGGFNSPKDAAGYGVIAWLYGSMLLVFITLFGLTYILPNWNRIRSIRPRIPYASLALLFLAALIVAVGSVLARTLELFFR